METRLDWGRAATSSLNAGYRCPYFGGQVRRSLYVTDLDGTLLDEFGQVRPHTSAVLLGLGQRGVLVTCATARSWTSSRRLVGGLFQIPIIVHNGASIVDPTTGRFLESSFLDPVRVTVTLEICRRIDVAPMVHAIEGNREVVAWVAAEQSQHIMEFWADRPRDERASPRVSLESLPRESVLGVTVIATPDKVASVTAALYQLDGGEGWKIRNDTYRTGTGWLEVVAPAVSKGGAVRALAARLDVSRIVAFGDDINDISMFDIADESYAMSGAFEQLRLRATGSIGLNSDDAVARWLDEHAV